MDKVEGRVAVLGVAIAGVVASIVEPGIYTLGSTVVGLTLGLILWAYDTHPEDENHKESAAYSGVLAFTLILVFGYPLNWIFFDPRCTEPIIWQMFPPWEEVSCFNTPPVSRVGDIYDLYFFVAWLVMAIVACVYRRWVGLPLARLRCEEPRKRSWWRRMFRN